MKRVQVLRWWVVGNLGKSGGDHVHLLERDTMLASFGGVSAGQDPELGLGRLLASLDMPSAFSLIQAQNHGK